MNKTKIILTAINIDLANAWQRWCGDLPFVSVHHGSIFDVECDAVVSPANSFGFMDGGIDRLYMERFGPKIQNRVQHIIKREHDGELLVGAALIVKTSDKAIPYLIAAPTMRIPMVITGSLNPYLATRGILKLIRDRKIEGVPLSKVVKKIAFPGLGTGVGRISPTICAKQVRAAIEDVMLGKSIYPTSTSQAVKRHDKLTQRRKSR